MKNEGKRIVVLPLDGFMTVKELFTKVEEVLSDFGEFIAYFKLNDAIHISNVPGPVLVKMLHSKYPDIGIFLDFKMADVLETVLNVLKHYPSDLKMILTVRESISPKTFLALRRQYPLLKIAVVSLLTDWKPEWCEDVYRLLPADKICTDAENIQKLYEQIKSDEDNEFAFDYLVCSLKELPYLMNYAPKNLSFICPGIRDKWMAKDHQERVEGIKKAFTAGILPVIGTQLTKGNPDNGISAHESRLMTIKKINEFFTEENENV